MGYWKEFSSVQFLLADAVKSDLFKAGYFTSEESVWFSCQWLDWLGITWESAQETIEIVDRRVAKTASTTDCIINSDSFFLFED